MTFYAIDRIWKTQNFGLVRAFALKFSPVPPVFMLFTMYLNPMTFDALFPLIEHLNWENAQNNSGIYNTSGNFI